LIDRFSSRQLIGCSIALTTTATLAHLWLLSPGTALIIYFTGGTISMVSLLTLFGLAAIASHPSVAAFCFATLMALYSGAGQCGSVIGGYLYEHVFDHQINPLIWLASSATLATLLWVPLLPHRLLSRRVAGPIHAPSEPGSAPTTGSQSAQQQTTPYVPQTLSV
jgi:MFS family permease